MKARRKRRLKVTPAGGALRSACRRRDGRQPPFADETPSPPWDIGPNPSMRTADAVARAKHVFGDRPREVDAVLGWLFTRFPSFGALGDDMVAHHALLTFGGYYDRWVELCRILSLFPSDP